MASAQVPPDRQPTARPDERPGFTLRPFFTGKQKLIYWLFAGAWFAAFVFFWAWWFQPEHVYTPVRFAAVTVALAWITLVPAYFILIFAFAKVFDPGERPPIDARIAMVVTKAPSEPFEVVKKTLEGALNQRGVIHATWLADEDPDIETLTWCRENGVCVSSRKGVAEYQRDEWPRRKRSKEGNLAYFYDRYGYDLYDIVAQFDADHIPSPDYLRYVTAPFADPKVGYVSAPSVCDLNADNSWSARGRLYLEANNHGALQSGYNAGWAPLCFGSHYTVRTAALRQVGGLGPELAEDHSTSMIMNAGGWKGVHAVGAEAHGEGPETFSDFIVQEFQWARSLVAILLNYTPVYLRKMPPRLKFQFLFSQLWYPIFSGVMALLFVFPIWALWTRDRLVNVTYIDFFIHMTPLTLILIAAAYWWRSTGILRPSNVKIISWEVAVLLYLRWPWALFGSIMAVWDTMRGKAADFRVTPKGGNHKGPLPFRIFVPYLVLALTSAAAGWLIKDPGTAAGFYLFNFFHALVYSALTLVVLYWHARENGVQIFPFSTASLAHGVALVLVLGMVTVGARENAVKGIAAWNQGITSFSLTETLFPVAGAGRGEPGKPIIRWKPRWNSEG